MDFRGKDAEHSQSGDDAGCAVSGPDGTKLPRTGHPDPWRARSGETLRACPACRAWGRARTCPASRRKLVDLESRGSVSGGLFRSSIDQVGSDSWQRRDQQLSIRRGSVRSQACLSGMRRPDRELAQRPAGIERRPNSANRAANGKRRKTLAGCSGEGQAVLCVQTAKKRPHFH